MSNLTSVEVVTFNMNGKGLALGEVISAIKKKSDLIVICIQEADHGVAHYEQQITAFRKITNAKLELTYRGTHHKLLNY